MLAPGPLDAGGLELRLVSGEGHTNVSFEAAVTRAPRWWGGCGRMIYVTGDTHGFHDIAKLSPGMWPEGQALTRDDYLVVLGDFGVIWGERGPDGAPRLSGRDHDLLAWWESRPWTTLWLDGNHENFDLVDALPASDLFGGCVQVVPGYPHVVHLIRGEVYDLPDGLGGAVRCLVMGGAESVDREWRVAGESWWAREMPSDEEYARCVASLDAVGWSVDYVLTHEVPYHAKADALGWDYAIRRREVPSDELSGYLDWVDGRLDRGRLRMWYAGHHHVDRMVMDDRHRVVYQDVIPLADGEEAGHGL